MKPVTLMALAEHRLGREARTGADFDQAGVPMIGGCIRCGATVAAYNSCPTKSGYICCTGCTDEENGWTSVEEANAAIYGGGLEEAEDDVVTALRGLLGWAERYAGDTHDTSPELWRHIEAARKALEGEEAGHADHDS